MKQVKTLGTIIAAAFILASCGGGKKDDAAVINDIKTKLEKAKKEKDNQEAEIKKLEADLLRMDTNTANAAKIKLINVTPVSVQKFEHFIDLQGRIAGDNTSYISSKGAPGGVVKAVFVKEGDYVKKGQLLIKLDDVLIKQSLEAAKKSLDVIKTQLAYSKNIAARQQNLWDQGIGTEVQLITAKANVEGLQNQLHASEENVKVINEQLNFTNVYSDVDGVANTVNVRVGETFQPNLIIIVNNNSLKATTDIPENYLVKIHKGIPVEIEIPDANKKYSSTVSVVSELINPTSRGFTVDSKIPSGSGAKPNQTAIMHIKDYSVDKAIVIPVNMVQSDETGKYVYVMIKGSNGKALAHRVTVIVGEVYGDSVEIKSGLTGGEQLITEGYQGLYEGQVVSTGTTK
ncbi:MAG: efflux RND transporter periplasmic adaptor subunit [Bacteroidetes bacterium]|nr:efflux RND transporter periplasmic adaptor subunit [Bacteroidota bacterium]